MDNVFTLSCTRGDPVSFSFSFLNDHGSPQSLSSFVFSMTFRDFFGGDDLFTLSSGNGLTVDAASGLVTVNISSVRTALVEIDPSARRGVTVPYSIIVGDLKITPPDGLVFVLEGETRPKVLLTVEMEAT